MDSNALLATLPAGDHRARASSALLVLPSQAVPQRTRVPRTQPAHVRELLTQRRVIDHGRRTTTACRRAM
ncbi:hypothetical protein [Saccharopolyspora griseoalba]|uniref:Uncharacterized protein n=1 Tax=Saccharopolyspora griseoalba TaxID=1431848 RepID=A0ABW2LH79_9PSEU